MRLCQAVQASGHFSREDEYDGLDETSGTGAPAAIYTYLTAIPHAEPEPAVVRDNRRGSLLRVAIKPRAVVARVLR